MYVKNYIDIYQSQNLYKHQCMSKILYTTMYV